MEKEEKKNMNMMLEGFKKSGKVSVATQLLGVTRAPRDNNKCEFIHSVL